MENNILSDGDRKRAKELFNQGVEFYKKKEYDKAIDAFSEAIKIDSSFAEAYNNRGIVYGKKEEYEKAIEDYNKAIEIDPNHAAYYNRGNVYCKKEEYEKAIEDYNKAIEINPNNTNPYNNRGIVYGKKEEYEKAIEDYSIAIKIEPNHADVYNNRGNVYDKLGEYNKAIENYNKAIEINPNYAEAYINRGVVYGKKEEYEKAIEDLNKAIKIDPKHPYAYKNRCIAYKLKGKDQFDLNDYEGAEESFLKSEINILRFINFLKPKSNQAISEARKIGEKILEKDVLFNELISSEGRYREEYKDIYIRSLEIVALLHVRDNIGKGTDPEPQVAHYTTKSAAERLLFAKQEDNKKKKAVSKLRLSTIATANDPQEGNTLLKYLGIEDCYHDTEEYEAFITCFTFNHESLNQFRLYGKENGQEATGVSIVIKKNFFSDELAINELLGSGEKREEKEKKNSKKYALFRCIYVDPEAKEPRVISVGHREEYTFYREKHPCKEEDVIAYKEAIASVVQSVSSRMITLRNRIESFKKKLKTDEDREEALPILSTLLLHLRYLVKHVAFKEEQECRIIEVARLNDEDAGIEVEDDKRMYIDYVDIRKFAHRVYFAPKTPGYKLFRDRIKSESLKMECRKSSLPFS